MIVSDGFQERLDFVLGAQGHCDQVLLPLADPRGKSVLVVGAGAGTEMLWAMRHGAAEVVGLDKAPQDAGALTAAIERSGIEPPPWELLRLSAEDAASLGRRFDLVLSYNVLEHLPEPGRVLAACGRLVDPRRGRIAVFTDPLYYSSTGSHLPLAPWEHLWGDPDAIRERLLADGSGPAELAGMDLAEFLDREISLNRIRLEGLLAAIAESGLVPLHLGIVPDRRIDSLGAYLERLRRAGPGGPAPLDLAVEGFFAELAVPAAEGDAGGSGEPGAGREGGSGPGPDVDPAAEGHAGPAGGEPAARWEPTHRRRAAAAQRAVEARLRELGEEIAALRHRAGTLEGGLAAERKRAEAHRREAGWHRDRLREVKEVLDGVEASASFRLGRALTAAPRWLRQRLRGVRSGGPDGRG